VSNSSEVNRSIHPATCARDSSGKLAQSFALRRRTDALLSEPLPPSSRFLLDQAVPHVDAAFRERLNPTADSEGHWIFANSFVSFVENQQVLSAAMTAEAERVLADSSAFPSDLERARVTFIGPVFPVPF
jgi:hypothetical protein